MVGRLVEQQQIRIGEQQLGQRQPAFLPAGERAHLRGIEFFTQPQPAQDAQGIRLQRIAAQPVKFLHQVCVFVQPAVESAIASSCASGAAHQRLQLMHARGNAR